MSFWGGGDRAAVTSNTRTNDSRRRLNGLISAKRKFAWPRLKPDPRFCVTAPNHPFLTKPKMASASYFATLFVLFATLDQKAQSKSLDRCVW